MSRVGKRRATQCFAFQPTSPNRRDATAPLVLSPATQRWPPPPTPPHCVATLLPYAPLVVIISLFNASITRGLVVAAPPPYWACAAMPMSWWDSGHIGWTGGGQRARKSSSLLSVRLNRLWRGSLGTRCSAPMFPFSSSSSLIGADPAVLSPPPLNGPPRWSTNLLYI